MPWLVDFKKGYKVTRDMIRDLQKPMDHEKAKRTVRGYKSIKGEVDGKGTPIGPWTKDTPRKEVAAFNNGEKTKTTTESETTQTSTRGCISFPSQECCQARFQTRKG